MAKFTRSARATLYQQLAQMAQHHRVRFCYEGEPLHDPPEGSWNYVCSCEDCNHDIYVNEDYSCVVVSEPTAFKFMAHPEVSPDTAFDTTWEVERLTGQLLRDDDAPSDDDEED